MENTPKRGLLGQVLDELRHYSETDEWRDDEKTEGAFSERKGYWERWHREDVEDHFEYLMALPLLAVGVAIIRLDPGLYGLAYIALALAIVVWFPWILWRLANRNPVGDIWRGAAILAHTLVPWALFLLPSPIAIVFGFPIIYVWAGSAMLLARRRKPPPQTRRERTFGMAFGAIAYAIAAGLLLWVFLNPKHGARMWYAEFGDFAIALGGGALLIIGAFGALSLKLTSEAVRAWRGVPKKRRAGLYY
jgi:hypothetical protein